MRGPTVMTCRDAIEVLADFLDGTLPADVGAALGAHLKGCPPCRAYLRTYAKTGRLVGQAGRNEMPEELKKRLRAFLLEQLTRQPSC